MKHLALFTFISLAIGNVEASTSIVGSWSGQNLGQAQSTVVATFLTNGEFFLYNEGNSALDPSGQSGLEYGTYSWNSSTGAFSGFDLTNTVGDWQSMPFISNLSVTGNTLTVDNGAFTLTSVPSVTNSILGSWYVPHDGQVGADLVTFLADGTYFDVVWVDSNTNINTSGQGINRGTYTWNSATDAFTAAALFSTPGVDGGPSSGNVTGVKVTGDQLVVSLIDSGHPNGGVINGTRVAPSAVPLPAAVWFFMTGLVGVLYNVRQKANAVGHGSEVLTAV